MVSGEVPVSFSAADTLLLWFLFLIISVVVVNSKTIQNGGQSCSWSAEHGKEYTHIKSGSTPLPAPHAAVSEDIK